MLSLGSTSTMFSNFLVTNKVKVTRDLFSGKIPIQNNPSVGNCYRTTRIFSPASHESDPTIKFMTKQISGPPSFVPAIPKHFTTLSFEQSGSGLNINEILEHPLKISEEEFDNLKKASDPVDQTSTDSLSLEAKEDSQEQSNENLSSDSEVINSTLEKSPAKSESDLPINSEKTGGPEVVTQNELQPKKRRVDEVKDVTKKAKRIRLKKYDFKLV